MVISRTVPFLCAVFVVLLTVPLEELNQQPGSTYRALGVGTSAAPDEKIFNIKDFYPEADELHPSKGIGFPGDTAETLATTRAWRAACEHGGNSRLLIPKGEFTIGDVQLVGPCNCIPPIVVEVRGTVRAVKGDQTMPTHWFLFQDIDGLILTGHGSFDGQGDSVWKDANCNPSSSCGLKSPSLKFVGVSNAIVRHVTSINSKGFHMHVYKCTNLRVINVTLTAPQGSPNTDGIHVSKSKIVKISKSYFGTGDDCISIGGGTTNITIDRVLCGPGHGISIGSLGKRKDEGAVNWITIKSSTLRYTDNGLRIKTFLGGFPGEASNIIFRDIIMDQVRNPIIIDQEYCSCNDFKPSNTRLRNVRYYNIRGTSTSAVAVNFKCSSLFPCQGIRLRDVDLQFLGPTPTVAACANARVAFWGGIQNPSPCRQ